MLGLLKKCLRVRNAGVLVLIAAVAAAIWFKAPHLGFDEQRPFAAASARLWLIGLWVFAVLLWLAIRRLVPVLRDIRIVRRTGDEEKGGADDPAHEQSAASASASASASARQLRNRVNDLVAAALHWTRSGGPAWRFGRHSVHRLPWYLVIGEPGAGKSTMLRVLSRRYDDGESNTGEGSDEASVVGWFGNEAVLFEAPAGEPAYEGTWRALIQRMRCVRRRCPANGIVVAVAARRLVERDEAWLARHGVALRNCIDESYRLWKRRVPVYVVVTQCDRLTGFDTFIAGSSDEGCAGPFGAVVPPGRGTREDTWGTHLTRAFDTLAREAQAQVIARMPVRSDAWRAAKTYRFPGALMQLTAPLGRLLNDAFVASPERSETPLLRSVHFAAVLGNASAVEPHAPPSPLSQASGGERSCFVEGFFRQVVFPERGLARSRDALPHRRVVFARVTAATCALLVACAATGLVTAYRRGSAAVAATGPAAVALVQEARSGVDLRSPRAMLALLDRVHGSPCGRAWQEPGGSWLIGLGLVREMHLEAACRATYRTVLSETVQPYVVARMTQSLSDANASPSTQFDTLRAYLMLGDRAHYDEATVLAWIAGDASQAGLSPSEKAAWLAHCAAWADPTSFRADIALDPRLIADVRGRLSEQPGAQRVFDSVMAQLRASTPEPLSVADMAGPTAALALYRKSGARLSDGVPGAYTLAGVHRYLALRDAALAQAQREDWILGRTHANAGTPRALADAVDRLYFSGYAQAWDALIDDVALRPLPRADDGAALVALLAGQESPLRAFLLRAAKETTLSSADAAAAPTRGTSDALANIGRKVRNWFDSQSGNAPANVALRPEAAAFVDRHFDALHRLVRSEGGGGASALDQVQAQLKEVAVYLRAAGAAHASGLPAPPDDALEQLAQHAAVMPQPLDDMLGSLAQEGTTTAQSAQRARIDERWRAEVDGFCHAAIDGRYPIVPTGVDDVTPADFTRLFASGGMFDTFFQTYLKPYVDTAAVPWVWRAGVAPPGMSIAALRQFERAARIREAFFGGDGKTMHVRFTLTPRTMDAALTRFVLTAGGQTLDYAHDPARATTFDWPDRTGDAVARIDYSPASADGRHGFEAHGAWSLFRLLDDGRLSALAADRFVLTYSLGGQSVALDLAASSVANPFSLPALHAFRCPAGF